MRVYLAGTGQGSAVVTFAELSKAAIAQGLQVRVEDPGALAGGSGGFSIDVPHADTPEDAIAVVRAMLDQVPGGAAAFYLRKDPAQSLQGGRVDGVQVEVGGEIVAISWPERDALLDKISNVAGMATISERFWAAGVSRPVVLNDEQRLRLRVTLELWGVVVLPDGLARLLIALVQADPGGGSGRRSSEELTD